jgi:hypothetical protein
MRFDATEAGYKDGLGGASNSKSRAKYHYILFGQQEDNQHPSNSGIYFEYDDQLNGSVNSVKQVLVSETPAKFVLADTTEILVGNDVTKSEWEDFLQGIDAVFGPEHVRKPKSRM